jgi:hypothetical protein
MLLLSAANRVLALRVSELRLTLPAHVRLVKASPTRARILAAFA